MERLNESIYSMYQRWNSGTVRKEDYHEYVDLGLPSGLLWATCNLGADTPTQLGDYYKWGGIEPSYKDDSKLDDCPYYDNNEEIYTKYNEEDGLTVLEPKDDAVHVAWGGRWRMPTNKEINELIIYTNNKWIENYLDSGVNGMLFNSKINSNSMFIPAESKTIESKTEIWSSSLWNKSYYYAHYLLCKKMIFNKLKSDRYERMNIRGVLPKS